MMNRLHLPGIAFVAQTRRLLGLPSPASSSCARGFASFDVDQRKQQIIASTQSFSFELTPKTTKQLLASPTSLSATRQKTVAMMKQLLASAAPGAPNRIYITKLPGHPQQDTVDAVDLVRDLGFEVVPHIPARGLEGAADLDQFLGRLRPEHVLIVGGSVDQPVGDFSEALQLLETGLLQKHGVKTVGLAAHPQGADSIEAGLLQQAFVDKLRWAKRERGNFEEVYWATQLAYSVDAIKAWERQLREEPFSGDARRDANDLRINLGVPGPASTTQLVKYAAMSGVANSVNYFKNNPTAAWNLLTRRSVLDDLIVEIGAHIQEDAQNKIGGFHFFTFGSLSKTLDWACKVRAGRFDLDSWGRILVHEGD